MERKTPIDKNHDDVFVAYFAKIEEPIEILWHVDEEFLLDAGANVDG